MKLWRANFSHVMMTVRNVAPQTRRSTGSMLTMDALKSLQADCLADDLEIEARMCAWTEEEARAFFESGGVDEPRAVVADASAPAMEQAEDPEDEAAWSGGEVSIGGVTLPVQTDLQAPELVPWAGCEKGSVPI